MKKYIALWLLLPLLSSCLTRDLAELPAFEEAEVTNCGFLYRFTSTEKGANGEFKVKEIALSMSAKDISKDKATVEVNLTIPAVSDEFPQAEREKVSIKNIAAYLYVSTAARIEPIEGAPTLGVPADFSQPRKYRVVAANGTTKIWTVTVKDLSR